MVFSCNVRHLHNYYPVIPAQRSLLIYRNKKRKKTLKTCTRYFIKALVFKKQTLGKNNLKNHWQRINKPIVESAPIYLSPHMTSLHKIQESPFWVDNYKEVFLFWTESQSNSSGWISSLCSCWLTVWQPHVFTMKFFIWMKSNYNHI